MDTPQTVCFSTIEQAFAHCASLDNIGEVFVCGGQAVVQKCIDDYRDLCKFAILTRINREFKADIFMPLIPEESFSTVFLSKTFSQIKDGITYDFHV